MQVRQARLHWLVGSTYTLANLVTDLRREMLLSWRSIRTWLPGKSPHRSIALAGNINRPALSTWARRIDDLKGLKLSSNNLPPVIYI